MSAPLEYVPLQPWSCEKCGKGGDVESPKHAGVCEVYQSIFDAHAQESPACSDSYGVEFVRVKTGGLNADPS